MTGPVLCLWLGLAAMVAALNPALTGRRQVLAGLASLLCFGLTVWLRHAHGLDPTEGQQLLNGLFLGSIYALIALGYTMVYGVLRLINFAHGDVFMVGAYLSFFVFTALKAHPALALVVGMAVAMAGCALLGLAIERGAYKPLRGAPRLAALITAIGVSLLLENLALLLLGASPKTVPSVLPTTPLTGIDHATGLLVNVPNLVTLVAAVLLMVGLQFFVTRTRTGRAMRAVSEDREAAQMMGINVDQVISATFLIGSALAGAGGVLWGLRYPSVTPDLGILPGLKAFVAAVLGGIGSIPGAMVGGLLIGLTETLISAVSATPYQACHCALMIVMLVAFWRLAQDRLVELPHTRRGRTVRAGALTAVVLACWIVAGVAASTVAKWVSSAPLEPSLSGSTFRDAVVFAVLIVILIVKPTGLMGRWQPEKV